MLTVNDLESALQEIIEQKYREVNKDRNFASKFSKIHDLEGNAIGQIGEKFARMVIREFDEVIDDGVIRHDEYDIQTKNGKRFEVKTARQGQRDTFQFNGINPDYNYDYLLCLGICADSILFRIFLENEIFYNHQQRKRYIEQGALKKQLVPMNPGNAVNYKLTLTIKDLFNVSLLLEQLRSILHAE
jgi:hypothetical protein